MVIRESVLSLFGDDTIRTEYDSVLNVYLKNISVIMCTSQLYRLFQTIFSVNSKLLETG